MTDPQPPPPDLGTQDLGAQLRSALGRRLPPAVTGGLVTPGRAAAAGLGLVVLVAAAVALLLARGSGTHAGVAADQPLPSVDADVGAVAPSPLPAAASVALGAPSPTPSTVVVDVAGRVRRPGVVTLPSGARIEDALTAAGGPLAGVDLSALDRAALLADGEQVRVGLGAPAAAVTVAGGGPAGPASPSGPAGPVDLNAATAAQLDALPGVGPVTAQRIVAWRTAHGRFTTPAQLTQIQGLGGAKGQRLLPLVTAG